MLGHSSGQASPFNRMPRTRRTKWVSGSVSPIHCAQTGIPRKGNMKPESRMEGRKKKNVICMACN